VSIILRFIVLAICAYSGSVIAGSQFSDLPADPYERTQR
jgi:hypothetical protein